MLKELFIENIAVIEKTAIHFQKGFHVLTGETGAGKSVLIGSINAILGERVTRDLVRAGAEKASVTAVFSDIKAPVFAQLEEWGFSLEEGEDLVLSREIGLDGRSSCRVMGRPSTVSALRELSPLLIALHGQHDNRELQHPDQHLEYIDRYGNLLAFLEKYRTVYEQYRKAEKKWKSRIQNEEERLRQIDILTYQVEEIKEAALSREEEEELKAERARIQNAERILSALREAHAALSGDDDDPERMGALSLINVATAALGDVEDCFDPAEEFAGKLREYFYEMEDIGTEVSALLTEFDYDPGLLDQIENRLHEIEQMKRKYGGSVTAALTFLENAKEELGNIEHADEEQERLVREMETLKKECTHLADSLTEKRRKAAVAFAKQVGEELTYLDMPFVTLYCEQEKTALSESGQDHIEFFISVNPGETPKPIAKVASGGELSRMMLSIKNVLANKDGVETLIFDEVDTGVSGKAAEKIGRKLWEVSKGRQVICVTHLAQVAALADHHLLIEKTVRGSKTYTEVCPLDEKGRLEELSRMIGGEKVTEITKQHANEMLRLAKEMKKENGGDP